MGNSDAIVMSAGLSVSCYYVVTLRHGHTCLRPCDQLLQNYKVQRYAVFFKDTLTIEDEKLFKACKSVCLLEPLQVRYPHQKCENFNTLSQFSQ